MRDLQTIDFTLNECYAPLVAYGDDSGLSDDEIEQFELVEAVATAGTPDGFKFMHWSIGDETHETTCEASKCFARCLVFTAVYCK